ncbi:MAG: GDSL-type esterase/lipase family protein [Lachnospiraceae bacterium]|nr:GDSL-type esterase/lipase family protein [Ruminococcus sp.]MCM1274100.1 GDSL-type esterase/lipase family protein [Lachnospiraceae bacterium]
MKLKQTAIILFAAAMLTACGTEKPSEVSSDISTSTSTEETDAMNTETVYKATEENVKLLGRTYFEEDRLYCALSGTGFEFTFTGTKCEITVVGDSNSASAASADNHARVGIYVNGGRVVDDMVDNRQEVYSVFESAEPRDVAVTFVKLSESPMSTIAVTDIKITGTPIKPVPNKEKLIEFVGDSITCGYGVDDPDKSHSFSTKTEDVTKAFAYKTAQALDADYSMVSFSGYGIISGYSDGEKKVSAQTLPKYYTKLGYSWSQNGLFVPSDIDWDFSKRQPDIIVINLGTNDDSYTLTHKERQEEYSAAYTEFLKKVRENNPDAKIVCAFGVMTDRLFDYVQLAVDNYTAETGDENVSTLKFDVQQASDGYSADWHPSVTTHDKTAAKLTEYLKTLL